MKENSCRGNSRLLITAELHGVHLQAVSVLELSRFRDNSRERVHGTLATLSASHLDPANNRLEPSP